LADGHAEKEIKGLIDGASAALILRDFIKNISLRKKVVL